MDTIHRLSDYYPIIPSPLNEYFHIAAVAIPIITTGLEIVNVLKTDKTLCGCGLVNINYPMANLCEIS